MKSSNPYQSEPEKNEPRPKISPIYYIVVLLLLLVLQFFMFSPEPNPEIPYSAFRKMINDSRVEAVKLGTDKITAKLQPGTNVEAYIGKQQKSTGFFTRSMPEGPVSSVDVVPLRDDALIPLLENKGVKYQGEAPSPWGTEMLQWLLPLILMLAMYAFIFRRMAGPGSQILNIGKNKASLYENLDDHSKITFKDVAGLDEAKTEVMEVVDFLKDPQKYTSLGGKLPKGVLLVGPPGTGKTLLAKAVAGEADVPFFSISGSDFVEMFVGVGAARVRDLFKQAKEKAPCIIFIDEIDAVGRSRGKGALMGTNDERENTLNQLLVEMDGFSTDKGVILIAATNRPDVLDSALLRPGRFDRQIMVDKPDLKGRIDILKVHTKGLSLAKDVNLKVIATRTSGFAGAELANAANEAALLASRNNQQSIEMKDFEDAIERSIAGLEKKNKVINPREKQIVAFHEAGHAIVGWLLPENDPVQKISIVPRGLSALGYTMNIPLEDRYLMTRKELLDRICGLLGGRIAEQLIFDDISTGAQNDLEKVTAIAYDMVKLYGMSDKVGNISFNERENGLYGRRKPDYSEKTALLIDQEVMRIIAEAHQRVTALLTENHEKLEHLASELLLKETLQYPQIEAILGKRPSGLFPLPPEELHMDEAAVVESEEFGEDVNGSETSQIPPLSDDERKELEAAAARLIRQREQ